GEALGLLTVTERHLVADEELVDADAAREIGPSDEQGEPREVGVPRSVGRVEQRRHGHIVAGPDGVCRPFGVSSSVWPRRSGRAREASAASTNAAPNTVNTSAVPPASRRNGTLSGARIEAMRPKAAADPAPVPRMTV